MKRQTTFRLSDGTRRKLDELTDLYGTRTEVVAVAVDRLYQATATTCELCGKVFKFGDDSDDHESDTGDICGECWRAADAEDNTFDLEDMK